MSDQNNNSQRLKGYRAVIPFYILWDTDLNANHYRLYGQVEQMESNPNPEVDPTFSYEWLAKQLGITRRNAMKCAKKLIDKGYLEHVEIESGWLWKTVKKPVLVVDKKDMLVSPSDTPLVSPSDTPLVSPSDTQRSQNIKIPKDKEKTIADSSNTAIDNYEDDLRFMSFYSLYPRKEKPKDAWKAFKALKPDDLLLFNILENVKARIEKDAQWQNKQFIPYPATYLRSEQYRAEIVYIADVKVQKNSHMTLAHVMGDISWAN